MNKKKSVEQESKPEKSVSEVMQDELESILVTHPTEFDESDDLEAAKRIIIEKALYDKVDNA